MALQEVPSSQGMKFVTMGGKDKTGKPYPNTVKGWYIGKVTGPNQFDSTKLKTTFKVLTQDGIIGINGTAVLISRMNDFESMATDKAGSPEGVWVEIKFTGTEPSKRGNPTKLFSVAFDLDNVRDVNSTTAAFDGDTEDDETSDNYDAALTQDAEDEAQALALAAAEKKAKVNALLNKGKTAKK